MVYAEYRPYPFTTNEMLEQKSIQQQPSEISEYKDILFYPSFVDEIENDIFTIFHVYIDAGDLRYSITIYNVDDCTAENIESKCLEKAVFYFKELFTRRSTMHRKDGQ